MLGSDWFEGNQGNEQPVGMAQYAQHQSNSQLLRGRGKPPAHSNVTYNVTIVDLINNSCLNGWTCGNIAATPMDIAMFHDDLHHNKIVSEARFWACFDRASTPTIALPRPGPLPEWKHTAVPDPSSDFNSIAPLCL
jgi:hypothetical protein